MEPLDLSQAPPRNPRLALDGLTFLPRTIDKARALLPGGNPGEYRLAGFSATMLELLGVDERQFVEAVGKSKSDDDVAQWLRAHATASKYREWNEHLAGRALTEENKERFAVRYPVSVSMPVGTPLSDVLIADDAAAFASKQA